MRRAVLLALLFLPAAGAALPPAASFDLAPTVAPADGAPFAVVVAARGPPGAAAEAKAWVGTPTSVLSRSFDGVAWVHGSRYAARGAFDEAGEFRAVVAVSAVAPHGNATLLARVRVAGAAGPVAEAPLLLLPRDALVPAWSTDALAVARVGDAVALGARVPDPSGATTPHARVFAPPGARVANATAPPAIRLLAAGADGLEIEAAAPVEVCVLQRGATCHEARGRAVLPLASTAPATLAAWGEPVAAIDPPERGELRNESGVWRARPAGFVAQPREAWTEDLRLVPILYPDHGPAAFAAVAAAARERLDAAVYTIRDETAAAHLADAAARGVAVRLLVEGAPVGGIHPEETRLLAGLAASGVEVRAIRANGTFPARYPSLHAKTLVADASVALVASENWNGGTSRGWGALVASPRLGARLAAAFDHDFAGRDAVRIAAVGARPLPAVGDAPPLPPAIATVARVEPVLAPDFALDAMLDLLRSANRSIDAQLLALEADWSGGPSPLVAALLEAATRGVRVRLLLDGEVRDNREAARRVLERAGDLPVEVRIAPPGRVLHNKGVVVDAARVLVGSINWGETSVTRNREVALRLDGPEAAAPFAAWFEEDWAPGPAALRKTPQATGLAVAALALGGGMAAGGARRWGKVEQRGGRCRAPPGPMPGPGRRRPAAGPRPPRPGGGSSGVLYIRCPE